MSKVFALISLLYLLLCVIRHSNKVWGMIIGWESYGNPDNWGNMYPECLGDRQSPIDIHLNETITFNGAPINFINYDQPLSHPAILTNIGTTVTLNTSSTKSGKSLHIEGGYLKSRYDVVSLHFHWGSTGMNGAEHLIDGKRSNAEMHIVHKNIKYETFAEALKHVDGLAVVGILLESVDNSYYTNPELKKILEKIPEIVYYHDHAIVDGDLKLSNIIKDVNTKEYFGYSGSTTTPPCSEVVTWILFPRPVPVRNAQLKAFYHLLDPFGYPLLNTFRREQNHNDRNIYHQRKMKL